MSVKPNLSVSEVATWLTQQLGQVQELEPLEGGFWSQAFAFEHDQMPLVVRFNADAEGFTIDRRAHDVAGAYLPVPEVLDIGEAFGLSYAISRRHYGEFLETSDTPHLSSAVSSLLSALRRVPRTKLDDALWYDDNVQKSWHQWLAGSLEDAPGSHSQGWRKRLAADKPLDDLFHRVNDRIIELLPLCPARGDLVHGDLLHQNVLLDAAGNVSAVFSWKCSARGDFLYDVAWLSFWGAWHPTLRRLDPWSLTAASADLSETDLRHGRERHLCYQLQIAASHFGWYLWTEDRENLDWVAEAARTLLEA